jgi:hypothetical protein
MMVVRSLFRCLALLSLLMALILPVAWLSHAETAAPKARLDAALRHALETVRRCNVEDARTANALHLYLAIEDYFRPAYIRRFEFILERVGSALGISFVQTLGVGQISRRVYLEVANDGVVRPHSADQWALSVENDCLSLAILKTYADRKNVTCDNDKPQCEIVLACFWHTGKNEACGGGVRDQAYLGNVRTAFLRLRKLGQGSSQL